MVRRPASDGWFTAAPEVTVDRDEILVLGPLTEPDYPEGGDEATKRSARLARIQRFP